MHAVRAGGKLVGMMLRKAARTLGLLGRTLLVMLTAIDGIDVGLGLIGLGVGLTVSWSVAAIVIGALVLILTLGIVPTRRG